MSTIAPAVLVPASAQAAITAKITALQPYTVLDQGDDLVFIIGDNLNTVTGVKVDGVAVEWFDEGDGTLSFFTPPHAIGKADVQLITAEGQAPDNGTVDDLNYILTPPQPTITSVSPNAGPAAGGNTVTIRGTALDTTLGIVFGDFDIVTEFTVVSDTELRVVVPAPAAVKKVDILVLTAGGANDTTGTSDDYTYGGTPTPAPTISGISPNSGSDGTVVTINGTNLSGASVKFGGVDSPNVTQVSATQVKATAPPGLSGTVDVTALTAGGSSANTAADNFTYTAPVQTPTVTSISPATGVISGGTVVTINGTNLNNASGVTFGGTAGTSLTSVSATQLKVTSPAKAAGKVDVLVTTPGGTSANTAADDFTYFVPAPVVTSISPATGEVSGGTVVTLNGQNLSNTTKVTFGGTAGTNLTNVSATQVKVTSPAKSAGKVDVILTTAGGDSPNTSADDFTYFVPAPVVSSISPTTGVVAGGTVVTINGQNLSGTTGVTIGGKAATNVTNVSATQVKATSPSGTVGKADVIVTTAGGPSANTSADDFTYFIPAPVVSGISPSSGLTTGGTVVTINGQNLSGSTAVTFGGKAAANVETVSDTQLKATSPSGTAGKVDISVTTGGGTSANSSADDFTYFPPAPTVTGIAPTSGPTAGGTTVTITGTNLTGATGVKFGSANATGVVVDSATQIRATSPAGSGTVDVSVTTAGGTSANTSADNFTYVVPVPTVTAISPATGLPAGGTVVTITGTNLSGVTGVKFGSVAGTNVTQVSSTQVKATSPAQAEGKVDISVTTAGGTTANVAADDFTYVAAPIKVPAITGIAPSSGPAAGGTVVTITGTDLDGTTGVKFGDLDATNVTQVSPTQVKATSPGAAAGQVDVSITTAGGTSANTSADNFTYTEIVVKAPSVSSVSPGSGSASGGTVVTITGQNLSGVTSVKFGDKEATNVTEVSATQVKATTPAGSTAQTVDVTVTTAAGTSIVNSGSKFVYTVVTTLTPRIGRIYPAVGFAGIGGITTIQGQNLKGVKSVQFGSRRAQFWVVGNVVVALAPPLSRGTYDVTITTPFGTSAPSDRSKYRYYSWF